MGYNKNKISMYFWNFTYMRESKPLMLNNSSSVKRTTGGIHANNPVPGSGSGSVVPLLLTSY